MVDTRMVMNESTYRLFCPDIDEPTEAICSVIAGVHGDNYEHVFRVEYRERGGFNLECLRATDQLRCLEIDGSPDASFSDRMPM